MRIGVPRESRDGQAIVAATPSTTSVLVGLGHELLVESGAGARAAYPDSAYAGAGAQIVDRAAVWAADLVLKVDPPTQEEVALLRPDGALAGLLAPARSPELLQLLTDRGVTAFAMDAVPRMSRSQSLDVLSSMANLSGYRAVVEAAHELGGMFGGQVTAAGTTPPARVFVAGAGVAGLAAIGAARALGAEVRATDVRPEVAEQVESLGATFVPLGATTTSADGYARALTEDQEALAAAVYDREARAADVVITTALLPGRPAPRLIGSETVAAMRPGSVVVDLAAATGGNVAGTVRDQRVVTEGGVHLLGWTDLAGRLPGQASQLYGTNMVSLVRLVAGPGGELAPDLEDEVVRGMTVARAGELLWPPPPSSVQARGPAPSAAPAAPPAPPAPAPAPAPDRATRRAVLLATGALVALAAALAPHEVRAHLTVFALAVVAGYYVISHVTHALHTPLMSVTNAISGIICVGALLQVGSADPWVTALSMVGITVASVNIVGGFTVTHRMLGMFRRAEP
ncbi:Re/Si-specific NAD(P)(+) transhydrogenase subunit alpha [Ornithinimicrobium tianjinense]|uniref:proton-translocating NAD(P)(+) transhydrogenase n=1 Tax=Ornithinimicrobium tianjinense TaxID=1195761 RepID=A0A917FB47_9MICO|nr:Re/Si-specific NAD(P)(+) transhydrogenase subunit alpha [Ornithinimicrobium tianjinense]GGF59039.1 NAD(P) transhydrogenase subunit alpha [Ornithinimicrobium tianjinense]